MADSLYLAVQRSSQYPRSPRLFVEALRLLYEFASVNTSIIEILLGVGDIFVNNGVDELFSGQLVVRREDAAVVPAPTTVFLMLVAMAGFNRLKSSRR